MTLVIIKLNAVRLRSSEIFEPRKEEDPGQHETEMATIGNSGTSV